MDTKKKGKPTRLNIYEEDEAKLTKLCESTELTITSALSMIVSAGLAALADNGYRVTLPLKFKISEPLDSSPSEKPSAPRLRK